MSKTSPPFHRRMLSSTISAMPSVEISEVEGIRSMHLGSETVQSSMKLDDPTELVLSYSRAMMGFLLFYPDPRAILQIGLGGGSLTRFIHHYLPTARSVAVDINPQVIAVARTFFELPEEGPRFEIVEADGTDYVRTFRGLLDVILVDGFDGHQVIDTLTTEAFFTDCRRALSPQGVFVSNWWGGDRRYHDFVERLLAVFNGRVLELPAASHGNIAVMAFHATPPVLALETLKQQAHQLKQRFSLEFDDFIERLTLTNQLADGQLIL